MKPAALSLLLVAFLGASTLSSVAQSDSGLSRLSIPQICQKMAEQDGYHFARFTNDKAVSCQIVAEDSEGKKTLLTISRLTKEMVIATKLGSQNEILALRAFNDSGGNIAMSYSEGYQQATFPSVLAASDAKLGEPFLELKGQNSLLKLMVVEGN